MSLPTLSQELPARLESHVRALAALHRYYGNPAEYQRASDYVRQQLTASGAHVAEQPFSAGGLTFRNVIARFGPETGELVVVGAHYDSAGGYPGADDNASGVAVLIEIGRLLRDAKLARPLLLVAYANEEPPFFRGEHMGSFVHAKSLKNAGAKVKAMICLEMLGYYSEQKDSQSYPAGWPHFYGNKGDFLTVVGGLTNVFLARRVSAAIERAGVTSHAIVAPTSVAGVDFSDHWSYWQHGYPGVMITDTAFYRNPHYHEESDTPDTLDYKRMAKVVTALHEVTLKLAQLDPTLIPFEAKHL